MFGKAGSSSSSGGMGIQGILGQDLFHREVPLNQQQERDIQQMYVEVPELFSGTEATRGWAFCHAPSVKWPKAGGKMTDELKFILERYYKPYRWECYIRGMKKYGILPWKTENVGGWNVPIVPPVGSGCIRQYFDPEAEKMVYKWYWFNRPNREYDPEMRFKVWYAPDMEGNYTSPAVASLGSYKMAKLVEQSAGRVVYQSAHMPYFMVHRPPKGKPGDEKVPISFGDAEEGDMEVDRFNRQLQKGEMSRNALDSAIAMSKSMNRAGEASSGRAAGFVPHSPLLNSESMSDVEKREGQGILERLIYLDSHWEVAPVPPPTMLANPLDYSARLGQVSASLVDFPLSMVIEQHAQHAGNFDAQITFARDRMKSISIELNSHLKDVMLDAERERFHQLYYSAAQTKAREKGKKKPPVATRKQQQECSSSSACRQEAEQRQREEEAGKEARKEEEDIQEPLTEAELMELYREVHGFEFEQQCTPLITLDQLKALYDACVINQANFGEEAIHLLGISKSRLSVTPVKRQAEMDTERMDMEKQSTKQTQKMESDRLALDTQVAKDKAASDMKKASQKPPKKPKTTSSK